jgi:hypothetical protein
LGKELVHRALETPDSRPEPIKQNDHALEALSYLAWSELGQVRTTDAYLAELERMLQLAPP